MRRGANQEFSSTGVLNYISFDEYILDLESLVNSDPVLRYKLSDRYPHELFFPDVRQPWDRSNRDKLLAEGHSRFSAPLYNIAFMIMAFAAVIGGSFNKLGYATRMAAVAAAALVLRTLGFALQAAAGGVPALNLLQFLLPVGAAAVAGAIVLSGRVGASERSPRLGGILLAGKPA